MTQQPREPDEYDLKIDAQVEEFLRLKQQLTYFLVSASVAVIVFTVNFAIDASLGREQLWLLVTTCIAGALAASMSLLNLHMEISSYRLHLKYRTQRIGDFEDIPQDDKDKWSRLVTRAKWLLRVSFGGLGIEIVFASWFMLTLLSASG